ncbi:MAG TPA: helix-turn-helix domain-containing protein [Puia sp.]|nr:helix-turn-helix domain-containing protein [Puia sp.]
MENNSDIFLDRVNCPVRQVLDRFGDKWSTLILLLLEKKGTMRFNQLNGTIGDISQKMLTVTLRTLEADGLISRKIYAEIPPRVEYQLTPLGQSLMPYLESLANWAEANIGTILQSREKFGAKATVANAAV